MNSITKKYPPGDFAIWIIIYIELITFAALFIGYAYSRKQEIELFNQSQLFLEQNYGFINTIILITSSYFIVKAIEIIKKNENSNTFLAASNWILGAIGLGGIFLILKCIEFYHKAQEGINISTNTFFMFYYMLTVFHFLHVFLGIIILFILYKKTKVGAYTQDNHIGLETGTSYWHMVDLLWIVLFPLIYIMR